MLSENPWYMRWGESGKDIPSYYLLKYTPKSELASKAEPIINQEHTSTIENMIKLSVLVKDWDDVIPREIPDLWLRKWEDKALEIGQEKLKLGLGEFNEQ